MLFVAAIVAVLAVLMYLDSRGLFADGDFMRVRADCMRSVIGGLQHGSFNVDAYGSPRDVRVGTIVAVDPAKMFGTQAARVVARPGDRVEVGGTQVRVNGALLPHDAVEHSDVSFIEHAGDQHYRVSYMAPGPTERVTLGPKEFYLLGDNRGSTRCGKGVGVVDFDRILGTINRG